MQHKDINLTFNSCLSKKNLSDNLRRSLDNLRKVIYLKQLFYYLFTSKMGYRNKPIVPVLKGLT